MLLYSRELPSGGFVMIEADNAEAGLHHLAFHDSLTGLPNRRRFHELLTPAVVQAQHDPHARPLLCPRCQSSRAT